MKTKYFLALLILVVLSCKKTPVKPIPEPPVTPPDTTHVDPTPTDPATANTIGFFLDDWAPKTFTVPAFTDTTLPSSTSVTVNIDAGTIITKVPNSIFGNNANLWMTQIVTEPLLMSYLKNLHPRVIRFPGGSISDVFFWNSPKGVPPSDAPDTLLDANGKGTASGYWYGKNEESWTFSVDNYYNLRQQTGSQGMITINYAYARYGTSANPVATAAHLAADWVRYDNGRTKYWEIGNEDNGTWEASYRIDVSKNKDGQPEIITGDLYGRHFNVFADSMRAAAKEVGATIFIGAQLLEKQPESWQTATDKSWNTGVLVQVKSSADFYIIHSYFTPYQTNATADVILNSAVDNTNAMMTYLNTNLSNAGAPMKPIALTEWNITSQGSMQQVSFINGIHAAILLGQALQNKYGETSRWDLANGWDGGNDMGLFNQGDEPGAVKWNARPAYYYMYYFQRMLGDRMLKSTVSGSADVLSYGSSFSSGEKGVILVNKGTTAQNVNITSNATFGNRFYFYRLTGGTDNGDFSRKVFVNGKGPDGISGGPSSYATLNAYSAEAINGVKVALPARSVVYLVIDKK
ncbi:MAG TPA: hypothetical protein VN726_14785 [Hanamia sp.]|nr:hypothetical protein [Hanamia sp.]